MLAFTVHDTKLLMTQLLKGELFDQFVFRQGEIHSFASFEIDGKKDISTLADEEEAYCLWAEMKPFFFQAIKGKTLPRDMKIVLSLTKEKTTHYQNATAVFLNLLFRNGALVVTTSLTEANFSLDRNTSQQWDEDILKFFKKHEIPIQIEA